MVESLSTRATIFDIQKFSVHDGPGIRTIIFFKGCPLRCQWCANPESNSINPQLMYSPDKCVGCGHCISICESGAIKVEDDEIQFAAHLCDNCLKCADVCYSNARKVSGKTMSAKEVFTEFMKDKVFYESSGGGITFSGGEPFLWTEFLFELGTAVKKSGFNTAVETCGDYPEESFEAVKDVVDLLLFDIKILDEKRHIKYCGVSNKRIISNLIKAFSSGVPVIIRIPIIPGINDSKEDISSIIELLSPYKKYVRGVNILPYHNLGANKFDAIGRKYLLQDIQIPSDEHMNEIKSLFYREGFNVKIGG